jgi:hypothetical protein
MIEHSGGTGFVANILAPKEKDIDKSLKPRNTGYKT